MDAPLNKIIIPSAFQELFLEWSRSPDAVIYAGGAALIGRQDNDVLNLPLEIISLELIDELHRITRTEHYLEIGSMVKLNKLAHLGKIVPKVLRHCIENVAGFQVRNIATIGGNICSANLRDIPAPLIALDAQYELRNSCGTRWISASRFHSSASGTAAGALDSLEILTRIRLPFHHWDYAVYKKFNRQDYYNSQAVVFLAKTNKNILSDIRIICKTGSSSLASGKILRNKAGEDDLNGKSLPLNRKTADDFVENWREFLSNKPQIDDFIKNSILACILENIYNLSE